MPRSRDFSKRQRRGMREVQSTRKGIPGRFDQMQLGPFSEGRNQEGGATSSQRQPRRADGDEPIGEDVDMTCGQTNQFDGDRIVSRGVFKNIRSQRREIAR